MMESTIELLRDILNKKDELLANEVLFSGIYRVHNTHASAGRADADCSRVATEY